MFDIDDDILTEEEKDFQQMLNRRNGYGISSGMLKRMTRQFEAAAAAVPQDTKTMAKITYRLNAINFHHEVGMLMSGEFRELREELKTR